MPTLEPKRVAPLSSIMENGVRPRPVLGPGSIRFTTRKFHPLDAIAFTPSGARAIPAQPIRNSLTRFTPIIVLALGLAMVFHETLASGFGRQVGDAADPRFNEFLLEHGWRWLRGEAPRGLFDVPMAWPIANTLSYSEPMLSFGPFYWPFRLLGLSPPTSHALWLMLVATLNFVCFFAFARRAVALDGLAASAAAFFFTFGLPRVAQIGHDQLWPQVYVVTIVWGMVVLFSHDSTPRARRLAAASVSAGFVLQAWGSLYNALFLAYACLATGLFTLLHPAWRARTLRTLRETGPFASGCIALSIALVWPLARAYLAVYSTTPDWDPRLLRALQPRPASLAHFWEHSWLYGWRETPASLTDLPFLNEQALGIGLVSSVIVLVVLGREWRRPSLQLLAFLVVALWLPTLVWPGDRTVWPLLRGFLPGLDALRAISRMGLLLLIPASLAIGLFVHGRERSHRPLAFLAIGAVCLLEQGTSVPSYPREPYEWIVEEIVDEIDPNAEAFFYVGAGGSPHWYSQIDALLASQRTGVPTINMYSGQYPSVFLKLLQNVARSPQEMQRIRARLDRWIAENDLDPERVQLIDQHALLEIRSRRVERYGTPDPVAARKAKAGPSSDP